MECCLKTFKDLSLWVGLMKLMLELIKYFVTRQSGNCLYNSSFFFFFFHMVSFLLTLSLISQALIPAVLGRRQLYFMLSQVPITELINAFVHLLAATVFSLWSHKSKLGVCMRELLELLQHSKVFLFISVLPS